MQDNEANNTSRLAINWWHTPASSADINPIERLWAELKQHIARGIRPLNKSELVKR